MNKKLITIIVIVVLLIAMGAMLFPRKGGTIWLSSLNYSVEAEYYYYIGNTIHIKADNGDYYVAHRHNVVIIKRSA